MRFIVAVIQPHKLDAVREALAKAGVQGLTVSEVRGFGRQKGHREIYRGAEYDIAYVPKVKLEVAVPADFAERVVETIRDSARTGNIGDGKIFVLALESAIRGRVRPELVPCRHRKPRPTGRPVMNRRTKKFRSTSVEGGQSPHMMVTASPLPKAL